MEINLQPGRYVVAVSGGVDSVVLLHLLVQLQKGVIPGLTRSPEKKIDSSLRRNANAGGYQFVVAHFDHGIREDSAEDRRLVERLAKSYGLPFVYETGRLGPQASEAAARHARYRFLHHVREASKAAAIITAHHQDDLLETIILNLLRGTGRRGLSSLKSTDVVKRPLLGVPKSELLRYAKREGLTWHEDSTNADPRYLRNYIRQHLLPRFAGQDREALLQLSRETDELNRQITRQVTDYLHLQPAAAVLDRHGFIMLPHAVAREVLAEWLLHNTGAELSRRLLERLVGAAKTGRAGSKVDVDAGHWLHISTDRLALRPRER